MATPLLTRQDIQDALAVSLRSVDELISTGDLKVVRVGRSVRCRQESLDAFIEARETRAKARKKGGVK